MQRGVRTARAPHENGRLSLCLSLSLSLSLVSPELYLARFSFCARGASRRRSRPPVRVRSGSPPVRSRVVASNPLFGSGAARAGQQQHGGTRVRSVSAGCRAGSSVTPRLRLRLATALCGTLHTHTRTYGGQTNVSTHKRQNAARVGFQVTRPRAHRSDRRARARAPTQRFHSRPARRSPARRPVLLDRVRACSSDGPPSHAACVANRHDRTWALADGRAARAAVNVLSGSGAHGSHLSCLGKAGCLCARTTRSAGERSGSRPGPRFTCDWPCRGMHSVAP